MYGFAKSRVEMRPETTRDWPCSPLFRRFAGERPQDHVYFHRPLYQTLRRHETVRRELSHLTDRELANICITRSDIERIASGEARS
jgi:uncharacterized protein YjiS (DUF1127 family)